MDEGDVATDKEVQSSIDHLDDYDDEDYDDDDLIDELEDLDIKDLQAAGYEALDAVHFDDDTDDGADEEKLLALCKSSSENISHALVAKEDTEDESDGADIGSDEERDILKEIREDIEQKVREEMKEELSGYQERMRAIEEGRLPGRTDDEKNNDTKADEDNEDMNPKLREAIIKMNKLDKILRKKVKREKEVKRERILLERRMRHEISSMEHGASNYREIKMNTEKFLALAPPPSHNEGVCLEPEDEDEEMPPLFQTQFDDSELDRRKKGKKNSAEDSSTHPLGNGQSRSGSSISSQGAGSRASRLGINLGSQSHGKKKKKDFIKRNKELAAEADQPVAMTDDEKRRLQTLLEGVDDLPEIEEGEESSSLMELNPFQLSVQPGEGFCPDNTETRSLTAIDQRLRGLMPEEDFKAIFFPGAPGAGKGVDFQVTHPSQPLFTRVGLHSTGNDAAALERFGERVLYDTKEERELKAKLLAIESQLEQFKTPHDMEDEASADCHLTDQQLDELLDQCARNMGHCADTETPGSTPRSQLSSRQSLMANPPRLTDEQLQQLLSDAQFPLSSRLLALRDDDQKLEEEDGSAEMIRAETWIAIRDAKLGEENETEEEESSQVVGATVSGVTKPSAFQTQVSHESRQDSLRQMDGVTGYVGSDLAESKNLSSNSTSLDQDVPVPLEERKIDEFAFTPDLLNPAGVSESDGQSALLGPHRNSSIEVQQGKEKDSRRESSGGARAKIGGSFELPRLPHPPQISSSSSSLRASVESDLAGRITSSSFGYGSRDSFDLAASNPTDSNNNGTLEGTQSSVRFPEISSSSFLIHTPQGMNNDERVQPRAGLPSRPPLNMVRNNLSDMSVCSLSASDREDSGPPASLPTHTGNSTSSAGRRKTTQLQGKQPTPPTAKKQA